VADFVYEMVSTGDRKDRDAVLNWLKRHAAPAWTALPGSPAVDLYELVENGVYDPLVAPEAGPLLKAMLQFPTLEALSSALRDRRLADSVIAHPEGVTITGTTFERRFYPVAGEITPGPLRAPFSYVVRYHRPVEDEAQFVAHYLDDHPAILARLPQIRSILCYLPVNQETTGMLPATDCMLGNEVAFDSVEAFNAAMTSPVRKELRAHFHSFPKFSGRNTHHPMWRTPLATSTGQRS
jgi:uncharacterized protein (TIGR02118 family)